MITIEIPFQIKHNGVRKLITASECMTEHTKTTNAKLIKPKCVPNRTLLQALTKAWYCQSLLDSGKFKSIQALAKKFKVHRTDLGRIMHMNLLAPDIQRAILDGTQPRTMNMEMFKKQWPLVWSEQRKHFLFE